MLSLTLGPKRRLKAVKFPREKAGRRTAANHGQAHQGPLFDPFAQQWTSGFPGDTWQCLEVTFSCCKFSLL